MSKNPRKFREPVRLIVSVEAKTVNAIDDLMKAGSNRGHHNRSEFVRLAIEREPMMISTYLYARDLMVLLGSYARA